MIALFSITSIVALGLAYYHAKAHEKARSDLTRVALVSEAVRAERDAEAARVEKGEAVIARLHSEIRRLEDDLSLCVDPAVIRHRFDSLFGAAKDADASGGKTKTVS